LFARRGLPALVAAKFIPGLGAVMPPMAGALGMSTSRFLLFDSLGSLFYGTFYISAGFLFHDQLRQVLGVLNHLGLSALLLLLVLVAGYIAFKYARRLLGRKQGASIGKAGEAVEEPSAIMGGAFLSTATESLNSLDFPKVALAVTTSGSQPQPESVPQQQILRSF
jgi:hypothetical protein